MDDSAAEQLARIRGALERRPKLLEADKPVAAVAAVFDAALDLLFIARAHHPRDPWSGHIAFPGGRQEATDDDSLAAAIRETAEEVGLVLERGQCLGQLDDLTTIGALPGMVIRPFVFQVPGIRPLLLPNREVASVHWYSLRALLADDGRTTMQWSRGALSLTLPCVWFEDKRLWGLTLHIVDDLLHRLDGRGDGLKRIRS